MMRNSIPLGSGRGFSLLLSCFVFIQTLAIFLAAPAHAQQLQTSAFAPGQSSVTAGTNITYEFVVANTGGAQASNAVLTVTLPAGVTHVANTGSCNAATPPLVTCGLGNIPSGASRDSNITLHVNDNFVEGSGAGFLNFSATATSDENPPANILVGETPVTELADLQVTNVTTDATPLAGEVFTYTIYIDNWGPSSARNVVLTDTLLTSDSVSIQSCAFSVSQGGGAITQFSCTTGPVVETQFGTDVGTMRTDVLDSLAIIQNDPNTPEDETAVHGRLRASFRLLALENLALTTDARAISDTPDPDPSNNQMLSEVVTVEAAADLSLDVSATGELQPDGTAVLPFDLLSGDAFPDPDFNTSNIAVTAGRRIRYTYTVTNNGVSDADQVELTTNLPAGIVPVPGTLQVRFGDGANAPGSCQFGTPGNPQNGMTCALGTLDADAVLLSPPAPQEISGYNVRTIEFEVRVDYQLASGALLVNNVLLGSSVLDTDNSDNLGSSLMVVSPLTGISGCSVGGPYADVQCVQGVATIDLNGFGFALPEAGPLTYLWSSSCPGAFFSDTGILTPQLTFSTVNPDNTPVSCEVDLDVANSYADSSCSGIVNVIGCVVDCFGAVGGSAELDRCGVCEGDGNSCLGCTNVDTSASMLALTTTALDLRDATRRVARRLSDENVARRSMRQARRRFLDTLAAIKGVPPMVQSCTNNTFCQQSSNVSLLDNANSGLNGLFAELRKVVKRLRRERGIKEIGGTLLKRGQKSLSAGQALLVGVPLSTSSCS